MSDLRSTEATKVTGYRRTEDRPWKGRTIDGYGGNLPTNYMLQYRVTNSLGVTTERWLRVKAMCYGNAASLYVTVKGETLFLDIDTEYHLQELRAS